jgi:hypothetical protein
VEPNYLPDSEVFFLLGPHSLRGSIYIPQHCLCRQGGRENFCSPLGGGFGGAPEVKFWENFPCKIL